MNSAVVKSRRIIFNQEFLQLIMYFRRLLLYFSQAFFIHVILLEAGRSSVKKMLEHNTIVHTYSKLYDSHEISGRSSRSSLLLTTIRPTVSQAVQSTVYIHTSNPISKNNPVQTSTAVHKYNYHGVNMKADFLKELDELDEYMVKQSKFQLVCGKARSLSFCSNVTYSVPRLLSIAPYFQDSMAEAAVDTLSILTKGTTTSCEKQLKDIFCSEKFPVCDEFEDSMSWYKQSRCIELISKCPQKAQDVLHRIRICDKLSRGKNRGVHKCIPYMSLEKNNLCQQKNVSSWLYHAGVEINSLLKFQFSLNTNLTKDCKQALTDQLCYSGLHCFTDENVFHYTNQVKDKCRNTIKSCENQLLSAGIKDLFLKCEH